MTNQIIKDSNYKKILFKLPLIIFVVSVGWINGLVDFFFVLGLCLSILLVNYAIVNRSKLAKIKLFCFGLEWLIAMVFLLLSGNRMLQLSANLSGVIVFGYLATTVGVTYWQYSMIDSTVQAERWNVTDKTFDERVVPSRQTRKPKSKWQWLVGTPSIAIGLMVQRNIPSKVEEQVFFWGALFLAIAPMGVAAVLIAHGLMTLKIENENGVKFLDKTLL